MINLLITILFAIPTVDGQRLDYGTEIDLPAMIGWSYDEPTYLTIKQIDTIFEGYVEEDYNLVYVEQIYPLSFFVDGSYQGLLIPEPSTFTLLLTGVLIRRMKCIQ